jgi:molybdopterin molybdotransferase
MPRARQVRRVSTRSQTRRPVKAFFQVVTSDEARRRLAAFDPVGTETVRVSKACGRLLAREVLAPVDLPHFHRANMDGYAVQAADTFGASAAIPAYLRITGTIEMGADASKKPLAKGGAMRIATGGMLPPGADAVVMIEHTDEVGDGTVEIHRGVSPWQNVLRIGDDIREDAPVAPARRRLRAHDLGALTGLGITQVVVFRRPRVGLLSSGDEIVAPEESPRPGQVRNINEYALVAMAEEAGGVVSDYGVIPDRADVLRKTLATALARNDLVLISGGSSVGAKDITLDVIASFPDSQTIFHGIAVAPGKPTILARALGKPVLGLPGHPVSALVIFQLFGAPLVRLLGGADPATAFLPARTVRAQLSENVVSQSGREDHVRVRLECHRGEWTARPLPGKSGAIFNLVHADGLIRIDASEEGLEAGTEVEVVLL